MFKNLQSSILLSLLCSFLITSPLFAVVRYVKPTAAGFANGSSWANATTDLQTIINLSAAGDEVWVAAGRYVPTKDPFGSTSPTDPLDKTFFLKNGVKIYGGFAGTETALTQRPATAAGIVSILSGDFLNNDVITGSAATLSFSNTNDNAYHTILCLNADNTTILDGFTINGGNNNSGYITINGNYIARSRGGGMFNYNCQNIVNNCTFIANNTVVYGGGIYNYNSSNIISNCAFIKNAAVANGGGGSGICNEDNSNGQIYNCIFSGNNTYGGTIFNYGASPSISNCTLSGNSAFGVGVSFLNNNTSSVITNCILWNPGSTVTEEIFNANSLATFNYCVVAGGIAGTANRMGDPKFVNAVSPAGADGIWRTADDGLALLNCSAAYNRGTNTGVFTTDILGVARPQGGTTDIGAYESTAILYEVPNPAITVTAFSCSSSTLLASGGNSYLWSGGATPNAAQNTFSTSGTYSLTATGSNGCTSSLSQTVTFGPTATISGTTTACNTVSLTAAGGVSYLWSGGSTPNNAANTFTSSGNYSVTVTGANGCTSSASANVTVNSIGRQYVNASVTSSGSGNSWATALKTVQEALDKNCVMEIWVAAGTYIPTKDPFGSTTPSDPRDRTFNLSNGLKLYGGFAGTETLLSQRNINANPSTLSGDLLGNDNGFTNNGENAYHVVLSVNNTNTTILDGFTVNGGNATGGGGISIQYNQIYQSEGAGINVNSSYITVVNCIFAFNKANDGGGAINTSYSAPTYSNCIFRNNSAINNGGGVFSQFRANVAFSNCVFTANIADYGAAMSTLATATIKNCTFFGNSAVTAGAGIYCNGDNTNVINSIIWGNTAPTSPGYYVGTSGSIASYSIIQGMSSGSVFNTDPLFVNSANPAGADGIFFTADDGLALQNTSPALDAGTNSATPAFDGLGNGIYNLTKDMGAYENQQGQNVFASTPACQSITLTSVTGNSWYYFRNSSGIIAAINPNGIDLGSVTATISDATGAISFNSKTYLGRSVNFTSSNFSAGSPITTAYSLRLYFYNTEVNEYNTATSGTHPYQNFDVAWWQGGSGCTIAGYAGNASGNVANASVTAGQYGAASNGFYLQFNLNHFTLFSATDNLSTVPLQLLSFTGKQNDKTNLLEWQTANEINTNKFVVESSNDAITFTSIGTKPAIGSGNNAYTFTDSNPFTTSNSIYYRLKIVDINSKFTYSNIIKFGNSQLNSLVAFPNPILATTTLQLNDPKLIGTVATLMDFNGRIVKTIALKTNLQTISLQNLATGIYILQTINGQRLKLVKN